MGEGLAAAGLGTSRVALGGALPIEIIGEEDLLLGMDDVKVVYNGPRHPGSQMEQLAFYLVSLVDKSGDLELMVRQMVRHL